MNACNEALMMIITMNYYLEQWIYISINIKPTKLTVGFASCVQSDLFLQMKNFKFRPNHIQVKASNNYSQIR